MGKFAVIFGDGERHDHSRRTGSVARIPGLVRAIRNDVVEIVHRDHVPGAKQSVRRLDELWCTGAPEKGTLDALRQLYDGLPVIQISEVEETTILVRDADSPALVKRLSLLQRKESLSRPSFCAYWRDVHAPMVSCHRHVARYVQNHVVDDSRGLFDGIAEFQITDRDCMRADYESDAARAMKADVRNFAATVSTYVVRAHDIH